MSRINIKKFNVFTLISVLAIIAGLGFYLYWGSKYGIWYDIGIYSITIVFVLPGVIGTILTLLEKPGEQS